MNHHTISGTKNLSIGLATIMMTILLGSALLAPTAAFATSGTNPLHHDDNDHGKEIKQKDRKDKDGDKDKGTHHDKDCDIQKYSKECKDNDKDKDKDKNKDKDKDKDKDKKSNHSKDMDYDIPSGNDYEIPTK